VRTSNFKNPYVCSVRFLLRLVALLLCFCAAGQYAAAQTQNLNFFPMTYDSGVTNGVISPANLVTADINGDGSVDVICANGDNKSLMILANNGEGYFGSNAQINLPYEAAWVATADFNGDGWPDLVVANYGFTGQLLVLTNNRAGAFFTNAKLSVPYLPSCVVAADVNGDGHPDLVSLNDGQLTVLFNNGSGEFSSNATYATSIYATTFIAADLNGSGAVDLITVDEVNSAIAIYTNNGLGSFTSNATYSVGPQPTSVAAADIYKTGKLALITANNGYASGNTLLILTNNGVGAYFSNATLTVGTGPVSVISADINGDGWPDIICGNEQDSTLSVLTNNRAGLLFSNITFPVFNSPICIAAADVNNDGKLDLITGQEAAFVVDTQVGFTSFTYHTQSSVDSVAIVDAYKDGRPDIVAANLYTGDNTGDTLTVFTNDGVGQFNVGTNITIASAPFFLVTADVNGDGWPDLVSANDGGVGTISVLLNDTHGNFGVTQTIALASSDSLNADPTSLAPIDLSGNGVLSLGVACSDEVLLFTNNGAGQFTSNSLFAINNAPYCLAAGNFNGTPAQQLAAAFDLSGLQNSANDYIVLFQQNGASLLVSNALYRVGEEPKILLAADINGDKSEDLVLLDSQSSSIATFFNNGEGNFTSNATYSAAQQPEAVTLADINGDGSPDLIIAGSGTPAIITILTNNGAGIFSFYATIPIYLNAAAQSIAAGDLNGDGKPDLVTTFSDGTMVVLINSINAAASSPPPPSLAYQLVSGNLVLTWSGSATLQSSPSLNTAFSDVPGATSPYSITPSAAQQFFRLKTN
jgi:hypothetical protein